MKEKEYMYIRKTTSEINTLLGKPNKHSDESIWFYDIIKSFLYQKEMVLFFEKGRVINILTIQYIVGAKFSEKYF